MITLLTLGALTGACGLSLFASSRSPILYDRLVVASLGAASGLVSTGAILWIWSLL